MKIKIIKPPSDEWISVKERLPKIKDGHHAVKVLVAEFDSIYEELCPGHGYSVHECMFGKYPKSELFEASTENDFMALWSGKNSFWGPTGDPVTHWMYLPKPPIKE
jgi:hypothetical protein